MKKLCLFQILLVALVSPAFADDSADLKQLLSKKNTLNAQFISETKNTKGTVVSKQQGLFKLKKPNSFLMHTTDPDETVLYTKGNDVIYFDAFVNQATIFSRKDLYTSPFMLLSSTDKNLWSQYSVKKDGKCFNLKSLKDKTLNNIAICFENNNVNSLTLTMADGNITTYKLEEKSDSISDKDFSYTLPDDVQIDDQR